MAITSIGYGGPVNEAQVPTWARALGGLDYAVMDAAAWKVTAVGAAARTVQVAAGRGVGRGIYDVSDEPVQVVLPNPASGQLWHLVVARRDTTAPGGTTTFTYADGAADPWAALALRHTFETTAGITDDQPLALVRVQKDTAAIVQVQPMRCWQANGGTVGESDYVRGYLEREGTQMWVGRDLWVRGVTAAGAAEWVRTLLQRPVNLLAAGSAIAGGALPAGVPVMVQAGTHVGTTDANGFAILNLPTPFPNGLLTAVLSSGDGQATGSTVFQVSQTSGTGSNRTRVVYAAYSPPNNRRPNILHRVNWVAFGW